MSYVLISGCLSIARVASSLHIDTLKVNGRNFQ